MEQLSPTLSLDNYPLRVLRTFTCFSLVSHIRDVRWINTLTPSVITASLTESSEIFIVKLVIRRFQISATTLLARREAVQICNYSRRSPSTDQFHTWGVMLGFYKFFTPSPATTATFLGQTSAVPLESSRTSELGGPSGTQLM